MEFDYSRTGWPSLRVRVDIDERIIHILDLDNGRNVSSVASDDFFIEVMSDLEVDVPFKDCTVLLYHADGDVTQWLNGWFHTTLLDQKFDESFMRIAESRRED